MNDFFTKQSTRVRHTNKCNKYTTNFIFIYINSVICGRSPSTLHNFCIGINMKSQYTENIYVHHKLKPNTQTSTFLIFHSSSSETNKLPNYNFACIVCKWLRFIAIKLNAVLFMHLNPRNPLLCTLLTANFAWGDYTVVYHCHQFIFSKVYLMQLGSLCTKSDDYALKAHKSSQAMWSRTKISSNEFMTLFMKRYKISLFSDLHFVCEACESTEMSNTMKIDKKCSIVLSWCRM